MASGCCLMLTTVARGDLCQSVSKKSHMIHADRCEHFQNGRLYHIRGIGSSSHADLQNDQITLFLPEIEKAKCRLDLKSGRMRCTVTYHLIGTALYLRRQPCQSIFFYIYFIYLYTFPVRKQRRRNISSNAITCFFQNGRKIGKYRSFAIGTADMNEFQIILRIAKPCKQFFHCIQPENTSVSGSIVQLRSCFFVIHRTPFFFQYCAGFCKYPVPQ